MGILVTGGAGFLGGHYIRSLVSRHGPRVGTITCLDIAPPGPVLKNFPYPRFRAIVGDISEPGALEEARTSDVEVIVNFVNEGLSAGDPAGRVAFLRSNVEGVWRLLEASRRWEKPLVHVSTARVYGDIREGAAREDAPLRPGGVHAASKAAAEQLIQAHRSTYGTPVKVVRLGNPFGPFQSVDHLVPQLTLAVLQGQPVVVYGDGLHSRDRIHVDDACVAVDFVRLAGKAGEVYNVGAGRTTAALEVAKVLLDIARKPLDLITFLEEGPAVERRVSLDTLKLQALGWRPQRDLHEALWETLQWFEANPTFWRQQAMGRPRRRVPAA